MDRPLIRYSFQPGPSQLYPDIGTYIQEALSEGLLSRYHRDPVWKALYRSAQEAVKTFLGVPSDWLVLFVSSATEAWQILVDASAESPSLHFIQGAFGERWYTLQKNASPFAFSHTVDETLTWPEQVEAASRKYAGAAFVGAVHVETSRGAALPDLPTLRKAFPSALIAIDATSSLGGLQLPWEAGDVWFASVQKCLGLPPGIALMILSPAAQERYGEYPHLRHNTLSYLIRKAQIHEPPFTPNLLGIYLLARSLPNRPPLSETHQRLQARAHTLYQALTEKGYLLPIPEAYRAPTVISATWKDPTKAQEKTEKLEKEGLYLGKGYGKESQTHFRIANFPALPDQAYEELLVRL